uniref:Uncharacterized protein n=1 Tax=Zea mays TaxID=4577 RepID=A0A804NUZ7_MAIZE
MKPPLTSRMKKPSAAVTTNKVVLDSVISLAAAKKPTRTNTYDMPVMRKVSLHRFLEKRKDRCGTNQGAQELAMARIRTKRYEVQPENEL